MDHYIITIISAFASQYLESYLNIDSTLRFTLAAAIANLFLYISKKIVNMFGTSRLIIKIINFFKITKEEKKVVIKKESELYKMLMEHILKEYIKDIKEVQLINLNYNRSAIINEIVNKERYVKFEGSDIKILINKEEKNNATSVNIEMETKDDIRQIYKYIDSILTKNEACHIKIFKLEVTGSKKDRFINWIKINRFL